MSERRKTELEKVADDLGLDGAQQAYLAPVFVENTCRKCGCTDTNACEGGCWWVEENLCSCCAKPDDAPSGEVA